MSYYNSGENHNARGGHSAYNKPHTYDKPRFNGNQGGGGYNKYNNNNSYNNYDNSYNAGNNGYQKRSNPYQSNYQQRTPFKGTESHELWMGDLDPSWTEQSIINIWKSVGEQPTNVKLIRDKINPAKTIYCFVAFATQQAAAAALLKNGLSVPGTPRSFKLNWASGSAAVSTDKAPYSKDSADQKGRNENSLFIGDLATEVTDQILFEKFNEKYPSQIRQVKVMIDTSTGVSKGFGFVRFYSPEYMKKALAEMNGAMLGSRPIRLGLAAGGALFTGTTSLNTQATPNVELAEISHIKVAQVQPSINQYTDPNNTTLIVKNLASKFTNDELAYHFLSFGDVVHVKLSKDLNTGYVKFALRSSAEAALLYLHGSIINGCNVKVTWGSEASPYVRAKKILVKYGRFEEVNVRLDQPRESSETYDESERLPSDQVNSIHVNAKTQRNKLLESLLY